MQTTKKRAGRSRSLTESAVMIALGTILSMITVVKLPFGGTVTACSMLPVILIAYRHGAAWGLGSGAAFALLQMLLGMNNIAYATSWAAGVAIVLLDYLLAFSCLGLAGIFRRRVRSQAAALTLGTLFCCLLRYVCHVIAGCTVWAGVSIPSADGIWYSLGYNAAYMVPETIITVAGAFYLAQVLDFTAPVLTRAPAMQSRTKAQTGWLSGGLLAAVAALAVDAVYLFVHLQSENGFDITLLSQINWLFMAVVAALGGVLFAAGFWMGRPTGQRKNNIC